MWMEPHPVDDLPGRSAGTTPAEFVCPRCDVEVTAAFYGPCEDCRGELRASVAGVSRDIGAQEYEPKMNVTPNAVATKE